MDDMNKDVTWWG